MRDAFGGVFMIRLMLVFIVIYVAFTAISFKYAKSFRIKNKVIDFVEQNQIIDLDKFFNSGNGNKLKELDAILDSSNYNVECVNEGNIKNDESKTTGYCYRGVVIEKNTTKNINNKTKTIYYNVYTFVDWDLGPLNAILVLGGRDRNSEKVIGGTWTITGEAAVVNK